MKIPIIRKGEYDIWSMRMRQYICHIDHNLWDVIVNKDIEEEPAPTGETSAPPAPKTAKQLATRRNQERVKSILLLAILDEYLLKFDNVADSKSLWEAIKSRFGGNVESKKMQKIQLEVHGAPISKEDINHKFLRSLTPSWNQIALIMINKPDIDEIDIDDLYNNLRVYEDELKRSLGSNFASQNLAFLSSENTSSTNEVSTANGDFRVSIAGGINQVLSTPCAHDVAYSFFAQPTTSPQLENEDFQLSATTVTEKGILLENANSEGIKGEDLMVTMAEYPKGIAENMLVCIGKFVFLVHFIILDMPEDIKVPLILGRPFLSIAHAMIDVFKRKITLRVEEEKIIFKSVKPASSLIKRVYMLSLRERMELDLEARLMGETLVLNRSLDPFFEDYIELNDLNVPLEHRRNQVDDLMPTIEEDFAVLENMDAYRDEGMRNVIFGEPFLREVSINAKRFEGMIIIEKEKNEAKNNKTRHEIGKSVKKSKRPKAKAHLSLNPA
ncbi:putative reverse transcriptase domain-containing protein [Tanacetum coccineum]